MSVYAELTTAGVRTRKAAALTGMARSTMDRRTAAAKIRPTPQVTAAITPVNALGAKERDAVLAVLDSDEFIDAAPATVYATLLARGQYVASISTMYRVLREHGQVAERRRQARHPTRARPELVATGPGQVYSWDITKLKGPTKGVYYDAYVMVDIYSRYIVGIKVYSRESAPLAKEMMREVFGVHGVPHVVHADRGTSMTSKDVSDLLEDLGVTRSHSHPKVSNDNPYSEALFKTAKYAPDFPDRFPTLAEARAHMLGFAIWYNHDHHHTGIGMHTPADVHHQRTEPVDAARRATLAAARSAHPERFTTGDALPKILRLPPTVWINAPPEEQQPPDHDVQTLAA